MRFASTQRNVFPIKHLEENGVRIIGTSPKNIELAEDRKMFAKLLDDLGLHQAPSGTATSLEEALAITAKIGYPSLVRPSFVLGGRAMQIVYSDAELTHYMKNAVEATPDRPVLVDRFLEDATEVDVDCISDGETTVIGAIIAPIILGPEMKSTGEVMGIDPDLGMAFAKSQMAAGGTLPTKGNVFISVKETDRPNVVRMAKGYADLGFTLYATSGTGGVITEAGIAVNILPKLASGQRPNVIDLMKNKDMALVINAPSGKNPCEDEVKIRTAAMQNRIPIMTTIRGADAALKGIKSLQGSEVQVRALQEYHS